MSWNVTIQYLLLIFVPIVICSWIFPWFLDSYKVFRKNDRGIICLLKYIEFVEKTDLRTISAGHESPRPSVLWVQFLWDRNDVRQTVEHGLPWQTCLQKHLQNHSMIPYHKCWYLVSSWWRTLYSLFSTACYFKLLSLQFSPTSWNEV